MIIIITNDDVSGQFSLTRVKDDQANINNVAWKETKNNALEGEKIFEESGHTSPFPTILLPTTLCDLRVHPDQEYLPAL